MIPTDQITKNQVLFDTLTQLYSVDFLPGFVDADAAVVFGDPQAVEGFVDRRINSFLVSTSPSRPANDGTVTFSASQCVPKVFRGQSLRDPSVQSVAEIPVSPQEICIADVDGRSVWTREDRGGTLLYRVGMAPPQCVPGELLFMHFTPKRWLGLLPLLDFLRTITVDADYGAPPLRAAFIFDDPNLHASKYGWIDYRELAGHAKANRYHVAMGMVPMNAGFASRRAVDIFRSNPSELSLLIHGNDHDHAEFARGDEKFFTAACAQALRRIRKFEAGSGLAVDRVLVPPHGACALPAFRPMAALGFEALCVSPGSLVHWNPGLTSIRPHLGLGITDLFPHPLPVLPRFGFGANAQMNVRLAAFLGQPIICRGHHGDCEDGLHPLESLAKDINRLGDICWGSLSTILRRNYLRHQDGPVLYIRPFSRRIAINLPAATTDIVIDWPLQTSHFQLGERGANSAELEILLPAGPVLDPDLVAPRSVPTWLYLRRALCEARDRLQPVVKRCNIAARNKRANVLLRE